VREVLLRIPKGYAIARLTAAGLSDYFVREPADQVDAELRLVYGQVDIDSIAGPSEVLIVADGSASPAVIAADMLAQAEHDPQAAAICVTADRRLAARVATALDEQLSTLTRRALAERSLARYGAIVVTASLDEAVELANRLAPVSTAGRTVSPVSRRSGRAGGWRPPAGPNTLPMAAPRAASRRANRTHEPVGRGAWPGWPGRRAPAARGRRARALDRPAPGGDRAPCSRRDARRDPPRRGRIALMALQARRAPGRPKGRVATVARKTKETDIRLELHLDGDGRCTVKTGIPFLDHMLELFSRHGLFDLTVQARGDLEVDYHHTVEDVGLVLGQAMREALADKAGIRRFGEATVPLDEALVQTVVDRRGGRSWFTTCASSRRRSGASTSS
jgi:hypothetical protein